MKNQIFQYWRVLACLSIVFHHTICLFLGVWPPLNDSLIDVPLAIERISQFAKAFGLTSFAFISGAVLAYLNSSRYTFRKFVMRKMERLLLPAIIFGILYWFMFPTLMFHDWPAPINGTHLWYLLMAFVCIMMVSIHIYSKYALLWVSLCYSILCVAVQFVACRTITECIHYFPVFYTGYVINTILVYPEKAKTWLANHCLFEKVVAIIIILLLVLLFTKSMGVFSGIPKILIVCILGVSYLIMAKTLRSKVYCTSNFEGVWRKFVNMIDNNCLAIYVLSQFILNAWALYAANEIGEHNVYMMIMCVCATTFVGALLISEMYSAILKMIMNIIRR